MNEKAARALEFQKVVAMLSARAATSMGKELCNALFYVSDADEIERWQDETAAALTQITSKGSLPIGGLTDIRTSVGRAASSGMLSPEELIAISDAFYAFGKLSGYWGSASDSCLAKYFDAIESFPHIEQEISRCIAPGGEVNDNASHKLSDIRRSIRQAQDRIRSELAGIIQSAAYKNMLQDAIITLRGERFCVPVKAEYRGTFPGMVHDQSASGATVFMEPLKVVNLNNKIKDMHFDERREVERILYELSGLVAVDAPAILAALTQAVYLDFVFAKAELARVMEATRPTLNTMGRVNLKKARHPLISPQVVVPSDVNLGYDFFMLLITGPNTGGKTVQLKTIGLLTLMTQAGLHIPADEGSTMAVFDDVFADIGDEQSIEQSLSTFSSHLKNIVGILERATPLSLILLDELGAGTDPTEGAALATALLEFLHKKQIRCVVTTHFSELKLYALSTPGAENASCEFDIKTLSPTYRLLIGIPGKSNAFAIAKRLGLMDDVIEQARLRLTSQDIRFEDVIASLEASKEALRLREAEAESFAADAHKLHERARTAQEKIEAQRERLLQKANEDARSIVMQAERQTRELLAACKKALDANDRGLFEEARRQARDGISALHSSLVDFRPQKTHTPPETLRRGDSVFIHSLNQRGTVSSPPDSAGQVQIQAGIMRIKVHISDLSLDSSADSSKQATAKHTSRLKSMSIKPEIDLRGMKSEEAGSEAEKYLDDAFLSGLAQVTLIHGKGTGALRKHIHMLLKRHPHVLEFRLGVFGEGEGGVTVVTLKKG